MLATLGSPPGGDDWAVEMLFDGVRAIAAATADTVRLFGRDTHDITGSYPEIVGGLAGIGAGGGVMLDGEIVAPATGGRPRFDLLARWRSRSLRRAIPVVFYVFDLLAYRGESIMRWPYFERRQVLVDLGLGGRAVQVPQNWVDVDGAGMLEVAASHGFGGIVTKRVTSPYRPGRRSPDWVKTPLCHSAEVIVGGWEATSRGGLRALLVGAHAAGVGLMFVGDVGAGFTDADRRRTLALLRRLERPTSPFGGGVPDELAAGARWVEPVLVGTVEYREFAATRRLRHPSWKGLRAGIDPRWVSVDGLV